MNHLPDNTPAFQGERKPLMSIRRDTRFGPLIYSNPGKETWFDSEKWLWAYRRVDQAGNQIGELGYTDSQTEAMGFILALEPRETSGNR